MATSTTTLQSDIKGIEFADLGKKRIEWANQSMKVLQIIRKEFIKNQPLKSTRIAACLHVTAETAKFFAMGLPCVVAGTWLGLKLFGRIDEATFRKIVLALLFISGAALMF